MLLAREVVMNANQEPVIIQGGMGVAVSGWELAKAVSRTGQLGVVSGTALDIVLLRRLQLGDPGGHMRRALAEFPFQEMSERILERYFIPGGKAPGAPFVAHPLPSLAPSTGQTELTVVANFVEVFLAKEGHSGWVGINYLEKIQIPTLPSLYGAMLAEVDYVLMGAGIPLSIPGTLDRLSEGMSVELGVKVEGATEQERWVTRFDPAEFTTGEVPWLPRPKFLAIVASSTLAAMLARKATGRVDGFVVEGPSAGGHNAPPRGRMQLNSRGEPVYGQRDEVDLQAIQALGRPYWLAGSYGAPERVVEALAAGATGVQVGTPFAFCEESGLQQDIKQRVLQKVHDGQLDVVTDPVASPTGFPFKILQLKGSLSDASHYRNRQRRCDLGYLRQAYRTPEGTVGWRCPAEDVESYVRKGGAVEATEGRKCLCNGLLANVGFAQYRRDGVVETPLVTCGDAIHDVSRLQDHRQLAAHNPATRYSAADVVEYLLSSLVVPAGIAAKSPEASDVRSV